MTHADHPMVTKVVIRGPPLHIVIRVDTILAPVADHQVEDLLAAAALPALLSAWDVHHLIQSTVGLGEDEIRYYPVPY